MAEVAFLHYRPDSTLLHKTPGTVKLLGLMGMSILIYQINGYGLIATGFLLFSAVLMTKPVLKKMKGALFFALIMAGLLGFSEYRQTGTEIESLLRAVRFLQIYFLGIVITTATDPGELGRAFYTLTAWIPFFPARRLQTLVTLTLLFLPLILDESFTVDRAARSRCVHRRKNPVIRLKYRVEPLLEGIFRKSEDISRAMASRSYGE